MGRSLVCAACSRCIECVEFRASVRRVLGPVLCVSCVKARRWFPRNSSRPSFEQSLVTYVSTGSFVGSVCVDDESVAELEFPFTRIPDDDGVAFILGVSCLAPDRELSCALVDAANHGLPPGSRFAVETATPRVRRRLNQLLSRYRSLLKRFPGFELPGTSFVAVPLVSHWERDDIAANPAVAAMFPGRVAVARRALKSKRQYVSCNADARVAAAPSLKTLSPKQRQFHASRARIEVSDHFEPSYRRAHPLLSEFIFVDSLIFVAGDVICRTIEEVIGAPAYRGYTPLLQAKINRAFRHRLVGLLRDAQRDACVEQAVFVRQGASHSTPIHVAHEVTVPGISDFFAFLATDGVTSEPLTNRTTVQVVSLCLALFSARSVGSVLAALMQFAAGNSFTYTLVIRLLSRLSAAVSARVTLQASQDDLPSAPVLDGPAQWFFRDFDGAIVGEAICLTAASVVAALVGADAIPLLTPSLAECAKALKTSFLKEAGTTGVVYVMGVVKDYVERVRACIKDGSLKPLWTKRWDPGYYIFELEAMVSHMTVITIAPGCPSSVESLAELRRTKLVPEYWSAPVTVAAFVAHGESLYAFGADLQASFSSTAIAGTVSACRSRFRAFLDSLRAGSQMAEKRVCPFMVFLHGPPGSGKTHLSRVMASALCAREKLAPMEEGVYDWIMNANFQDGFSHRAWGVMFDDVDQSAAPPAAGHENHYEVVLKVVNNKPLPVEQAFLSLKGRIRANPLLAMYATNFPNACLVGNGREPNAFWRRVHLRVAVLAKDAYSRHPGSGLLDRALAAAAGTHELYDLWVSEFNPKETTGLPWTKGVKVSLSELMQLFFQRYDTHMSYELAALSASKDAGLRCPTCFLDVSQSECGCASTTYQAALPGWPEIVEIASHARRFVEARLALGAALTEIYARRALSSVREVCGQAAHDLAGHLRAARRYVEAQVTHVVFPYILANIRLAAVALGAAVVVVAAVARYLRYQGREALATGVAPSSWLRARQDYIPGIPAPTHASTFTYAELLAARQTSVFPIGVQDSQGFMHLMWVTMLTQSVGVTCTHLRECAAPGTTFTIQYPNFPVEVKLTPTSWIPFPLNSELHILVVPAGRPCVGLLGKIPLAIDASVIAFDEVVFPAPGDERKATFGQVQLYPVGRVVLSDYPSFAGDCGLPVFARFQASWKCVGIHYARQGVLTRTAVAALIARQSFETTLQSHAVVLQGISTISGAFVKKGAPSFHHCPAKSEVLNAVSNHGARAHIYGELAPVLPGGRAKTKLRRSLLAPLLRAYIDRLTGSPLYWGFPDFRGALRDNRWESPFSAAFSAQRLSAPDWDLMLFCIADYLRGMHTLDVSGYGVLSEAQAIRGVDGSYVHSINTRTSAGPPYAQPKSSHYALDGCPGFSPEMARVIDEVEAALAAGLAPVAHGVCTLKDEPLRVGKPPRVFINLPSGYNIALKRRIASITSFMRANMEYSECAVGIDLTSRDVHRVVAHLTAADPTLTNIHARDAVKMDKAFSAFWWDVDILIFGAIAQFLGLPAREVRALLYGAKCTVVSVKGDCFTAFWNPSGIDFTVQANGPVISVGERYVYYREMFKTRDFPKEWLASYRARFLVDPRVELGDLPDVFTFRRDVALLEYGDDNISATRVPPPPDYEAVWADELGIVMTDDRKTGVSTARPLADVTFLKRSFVYDAELRGYKCPLALKSIGRMLDFARDSTLSDVDHAVVSALEALREMVLHGEAAYNELLLELNVAFGKLGYLEHPLWTPLPYRLWRQQQIDGTFQVWVARSNLPVRQLAEDLQYQSDVPVCLRSCATTAKSRKTVALPGLNQKPRVSLCILLLYYIYLFLVFGFNSRATLSFSARRMSEQLFTPIKTMSQATIAKSDSDPAQNSEVTTPSTTVPYGVGEVTSSSSMVTNVASEVLTRFQTFPDTDLGDFLSRPVEIGTYSLSATDTPLTALSGMLFPWLLFLSNPAVQAKTATYSYVNARLQLIFVAAVPGNSYGSYVFSAVPNGRYNPITDSIGSVMPPAQCLQVDHHVRLDCAASENLVLELPWVWPFDVGDLSEVPTMWSLYATTLAPLQTAIPGGVTVGSVRVLAALAPGYQLIVPRFQGKIHTSAHSGFTPTGHTKRLAPLAHAVQVAAGLVKSHEVGHHGGPAEGVAGAVQGVASALSGVPVIGEYAGSIAKVAAKAKSLFHHFGFSREYAEVAPTPIVSRSVTNVARTDADDRSDVADFLAPGEISTDPRLVGSLPEDQGSSAAFFSRWTAVDSFTWTAAATAGTVLGTTPVTPYLSTGTGVSYDLTSGGYYGLPFSKWRADMEYLLILPVSKLHRGSLQVIWNNGLQSTIPTAPTNLTLNLIIDVSDGGDYQFGVGFAQDKPFLDAYIYTGATSIYAFNALNGMISFMVMNPLQSQNSVAPVIGTIFARVRPEAQFTVPRNRIFIPDNTSIVLPTDLVYQGATGDGEPEEDRAHTLVAPSGPYPTGDLLYPAETLSPRALMQKPSLMYRIDATGLPGISPFYMPLHIPLPNFSSFNHLANADALLQGYGMQFTWSGHFLACFVGVAASSRWKIIPSFQAWCGAMCFEDGSSSAKISGWNSLAPYSYSGPTQGCEFVVPYNQAEKFTPTCVQRGVENRRDLLVCQDDAFLSVTNAVFYSLGPDIRLAPFRFTPTCAASTVLTTKPGSLFNTQIRSLP